MIFVSKAIRLKNSFLIFYDVNLIVIKLRCFTEVSYLEGIRRNQATKMGINGIMKCKCKPYKHE
jgi:hypothetical protein